MVERIIFGLLFIVGYFALGGVSGLIDMTDSQRGVIRDMLLTVGPVLGMIAQAVWKTSGSEQKQAETINTLANQVSSNTNVPVSGTVTFDQGTMTNANTDNRPTDPPDDSLSASGTGMGSQTWKRPQN